MPTVNSYKRMGVGAPSSGATWAPAYVSYGANNRTQMFRVPEEVASRTGAATVPRTPYLALTAVLTSGLDGVDRNLDPGDPNTDNLFLLSREEIADKGIHSVPPTLLHAADELAKDDVLREAFGPGRDGSDYLDYYVSVKQAEFHAYHATVTNWETDRYLILF